MLKESFILKFFCLFIVGHKVLTHVEYRAVSDVFQNIDPPPLSPSSNQRVCPPPAPKARGTHSPDGEGMGSQYFGRRQP
jgi:hypothetical protein